MNTEDNKLSFEEHIRKRPGMYFGAVGSKGIISLVKGLIIETNRVFNNEANFFHFTILNINEFELKIKSESDFDILFELQDNVMTSLNKFYFRALNAICDKYDVSRNETILTIKWKFSLSVIKDTNIDFLSLTETLAEVAYLNRESEFLITDYNKKYKNQSYLCYPEGIKYVYDRCKIEALGKPVFEFEFDDLIGDNHYQIFLGYRTDWYPNPQIQSYANEIHTICGGSLVNGIYKGLVSGCENYVNNKMLNSYNIKRSKFDNGLILVCSVKGDGFKYGGSFKESLAEDKIELEVLKLVEELTFICLDSSTEIAEKFLWRFDESQLTSGIMETK